MIVNKDIIVREFVQLITAKLNALCPYKNNTQPIYVVKSIVRLNVNYVIKNVLCLFTFINSI